MFIKESTLAKLMNGTPLEEEERVKIMTALAKEAQEREDRKKANQDLRDGIVRILSNHFPYSMTTSAIKSELTSQFGAQYSNISEAKIWWALDYLKCEEPRCNVEFIPKRISTPCGMTRRMTYRVSFFEDATY